MITLEKITVKQPELDLIAKWRNESMDTLRASDLTAKGYAQEQWVKGHTESEKYYFIYYYDDTPTPKGEIGNVLVGYCGLDKIHPAHRTAELSLLIAPHSQNRGFGRKVVRLLLEKAFFDLNLNCIFIEVIGFSDTYTNFWNKLGFFTHEGKLRERFYKRGSMWSSTIASITKTEFEEMPYDS